MSGRRRRTLHPVAWWGWALLLALAERHVKAERATCEYAGKLGDPGELRAERAPATFSWVTRDMSRSGVMGNAQAGTKEKGLRWLPLTTQGLAEAIARMSRELKAQPAAG